MRMSVNDAPPVSASSVLISWGSGCALPAGNGAIKRAVAGAATTVERGSALRPPITPATGEKLDIKQLDDILIRAMRRNVNTSELPRPLSTGLGYLIRIPRIRRSRAASPRARHIQDRVQLNTSICALLEEDGISQIELSERVRHMNRATVTSAVDTMEAQGIVKRVPDPHDRRIYLLNLTPKG